MNSRLGETYELVKKEGVLRARDLARRGLSRQYLRTLAESGTVLRVARGLYEVEGSPVTENHTLVQACKRVPHGVICLLSALRLHGLTTQLPHEVWMALDRKARKPAVEPMPLRIVRFSGAALSSGREVRILEGMSVVVYDPAKTVADCFKYRNKIGLDVALEALRDCWRQKKATMEQLWAAARICRMTRVMQPYLEWLT